jgi:hypothetical protein
MVIQRTAEDGSSRVAKLNLVDLAGSEKVHWPFLLNVHTADPQALSLF